MTPYQKHKRRWSNCKRCELCGQRQRVVLARGELPCEVLFVGEAPGASEDVLGRPFVGPAGKLLNRIIQDTPADELRCAFTNLVACFPRESKGQGINEPPEESIRACSPRLVSFVEIAKPKLIVFVGSLAAKWGGNSLGYKHADEFTSIIHPAAILRMSVEQKPLAIRRCIAQIASAVDSL